ncbi:HAD-like protein [Backusella circina FSU 941]|nr:HAD-like protein [Backusella circina FSU 941]KAI8882409.1 HAD-like protein [Backusella circina FSU 941]
MTAKFSKKGFIFDLDGTIIDTTPIVIDYWTRFAEERQLDPNKILETSHGRRTIETFQKWAPELATESYVTELEKKISLIREGVTLLPGVMDLFNSIDAECWTINTACTIASARNRLQQFGIKIPEKMSTGDMLTFGKPHPEGYLKAAGFLCKPPGDCIVFEDAPAGVAAARAAGMECIACTTTHTFEQLKEAGATVIVSRLSSVSVEKEQDGTFTIVVNDVLQQ